MPRQSRILFAGGTTKVYRSSDGGMSWSASSPNVNGEVRSLGRLAADVSQCCMRGRTSAASGAVVPMVERPPGKWKQITPGSGIAMPGRRLTSVLADPQDTFGVLTSRSAASTPRPPEHAGSPLSRRQHRQWEHLHLGESFGGPAGYPGLFSGARSWESPADVDRHRHRGFREHGRRNEVGGR